MNNTLCAVFGCLIIFVCTTLGATIVFFIKKEFSKKLNSIICGFSAGVMIAASFFGLILPALENSEHYKSFAFVPVAVGITLGCFFLHAIDLVTKAINKKKPSLNENTSQKNKLMRFVLAFTVHNIPEGMAVGVAIGNALALGDKTTMLSAIMLAVGIAIQNIPEGIAVALPVYKETKSKAKGFLWGTISGVVEPIFAAIGLLLASRIQVLLAWSLSFSAGAMLFVTVEDLIPEAKYSETSHVGTWSIMLGFIIMMILDVALK